MELGLEGKTVIVTGGASHIGRGITLAFAKEKCNVVIADIDEQQAHKVAEEAENLGGKAIAVRTDVTIYDSVQEMVKKTMAQFGKIDVLVNNVGYVANNLFIKKPREEYEPEIKINYLGVINCTRAVLDHMIEHHGGKIVNIASDSGRVGEPREAVYSGTKGAVIAFGKAIAKEMGRHGINVNSICPGITLPERPDTVGKHSMWSDGMTVDMIPSDIKDKIISKYPLGRLGRPEDIANLAVFLASDASSFITGQTISVSGGFSML